MMGAQLFVCELQLSTCRSHTRDNTKRLEISFVIANLLVVFPIDSERATLGCVETHNASIGAYRTSL